MVPSVEDTNATVVRDNEQTLPLYHERQDRRMCAVHTLNMRRALGVTLLSASLVSTKRHSSPAVRVWVLRDLVQPDQMEPQMEPQALEHEPEPQTVEGAAAEEPAVDEDEPTAVEDGDGGSTPEFSPEELRFLLVFRSFSRNGTTRSPSKAALKALCIVLL